MISGDMLARSGKSLKRSQQPSHLRGSRDDTGPLRWDFQMLPTPQVIEDLLEGRIAHAELIAQGLIRDHSCWEVIGKWR